MTAVTADRLLAQLDDRQREVAEALVGPVCVLAGAGTGKTRAITHRIAYGVATGAYDPRRVMALTFTTRAAGELLGRLRALGADGVSARTFHSAALRQLAYFWPTVVGGAPPRVLDGKAQLLGQAAQALKIPVDTAALRDLAGEIEWRKVTRLSIDDYALRAPSRSLPGGLTVEQVVDLQRHYEDVKDERRQIDFEDVLLATAGMLENEPRVAEQVREQYRFFVVDEYQDVSPLQHDLLSLWLGGRRELCVVGDASQTIYSFTGATSDYLVRFADEYPEAAIVRLEDNYRSTAQIVESANRLMRGRAGALTLRAARDGASGPAPSIRQFADDVTEAQYVAEQIAQRISDGAAPESIAVLYRINTQSIALEAALRRQGVPVQSRANSRFFDQPEVRQAMLLLRGASVAVGDEPLFKSVSDVLRGLGWRHDPPIGGGAERARWDAMNALLALAEEAPAGTTLGQFVDELRLRAEQQHAPTISAVTLSTLHAAKGLEWDHVHLVGLSEGLVPISYAGTDLSAIDEERRLLYVGLTRARRTLALSWAASGSGSRGERSPSRFLAELSPPRSASRR